MLRDEVRINRLVLRNRIVMPPMATGKAVDGALCEYYAARAGGPEAHAEEGTGL